MLLFFTAAKVVILGRTIRELEEGHAVLMRAAFARFAGQLPPDIDKRLLILSNQRMDMPEKRADGTIGLYGLVASLFRAQVLPKYHHAMRQAWNHPTKSLPKVQQALYTRLVRALMATDPRAASILMGQALHTLQDTYTMSHTWRENNADPCSPMRRVHYSPSKIHPLISKDDRVWADEAGTILTPEAEAAITATLAALELWVEYTGQSAAIVGPQAAAFVERYAPVRGPTVSTLGR